MLKRTIRAVPRNITALLTVFFLAACVHNPGVTGEWREPGKTSSMELRRDGTFTATDDMGMTVNGRYSLRPAGEIRFEIRHPDSSVETIRGSITLQGDELRLADEGDKEVLIYRRIK